MVLGHFRGALGALLGHSWGLPGSPCGTFRALLGGLGVFLGLPDRHQENTCWLIDFYDDSGLVLGGSLGLLRAYCAALGALGASQEHLGGSAEAFGRVCGSLTFSRSNLLHHVPCSKEVLIS